jgi:hypothetical protein
MPILAALIKGSFAFLVSFGTLFLTTKYAIRLAAVLALAAAYVVAVAIFTAFIAPLFAQLFSSGIAGTVLGLAFPPIAGTVVAGLSALWVAMITYRYTAGMVRTLVP